MFSYESFRPIEGLSYYALKKLKVKLRQLHDHHDFNLSKIMAWMSCQTVYKKNRL
jgi:hypothetical protein